MAILGIVRVDCDADEAALTARVDPNSPDGHQLVGLEIL